METKRSRKDELDSFWDISALVPQKKSVPYRPPSTSAVEITDNTRNENKSEASESTVIKRYITPRGGSELSLRSQLDEICEYSPSNSLIHKVKIYKYKTPYAYYDTFLKNAVSYIGRSGEKSDFCPFFSYVPQYDQMNSEQMSYYFWFRQNAQNGVFLKTDFGYLFLYIFELINLGNRLDVKKSQYILMSLWNEYNSEFPAITTKLADWICDFSLLHRLPPPVNISSDIIRKTVSLKEFYIGIPQDDSRESVKILLRYCNSYDYRKSKFYSDINKELFDRHIPEALRIAVEFYSDNGNILSDRDTGDSMITRDVYAGAVCVAEQKYRIEVSYCSFSRSNELRFLVGDIVKYSENKLRAHIGIKSKMTVYSLGVELRRLLDEYFSVSLPSVKRSRQVQKKQEYEVLYDVPKKPLSLTDAAKIEAGSWETTKELIVAFEDDIQTEELNEQIEENVGTITSEIPNDDPFNIYRKAIVDLTNGNPRAITELASELGRLPDSVVDDINEIAFDTFGDTLIDDDGMGGHTVIEDYIEYFK